LTYWKTDSDESIEFNLPEKPSFLSRVLCRKDEVNKSALKQSTTTTCQEGRLASRSTCQGLATTTTCQEGWHPDEPMDIDQVEQGEGDHSCRRCVHVSGSDRCCQHHHLLCHRSRCQPPPGDAPCAGCSLAS